MNLIKKCAKKLSIVLWSFRGLAITKTLLFVLIIETKLVSLFWAHSQVSLYPVSYKCPFLTTSHTISSPNHTKLPSGSSHEIVGD